MDANVEKIYSKQTYFIRNFDARSKKLASIDAQFHSGGSRDRDGLIIFCGL